MRNSREACRAFRKQAAWVWESMDDAYSFPIGLNEETLTEMLLLKLARQFRGRGIEIKSFTKYEEGTSYRGGAPTGADWEWRFEGPSGLGKTVRIQAKRLYMRDGNYGGLDGMGQQRKTLVSSCGAAIPLYVLYNGPSTSLLDGGRMAAFPWLKRHGPKFCYWPYWDLELWGCAIAAEPFVPKIKKPAPSDFPKMEPWHALVCNCDEAGPTDFGMNVSKNLERIYGGSGLGASSDLNFEPDDERPWWAASLLHSQPLEGMPEGLQGVAIIRQID